MDLVLLDIDSRGVATITLNRPERLNAINMEMRDLLWQHLGACRDIPEVQVIVFKGEGRCFSAGADLKAALQRPGGVGGPPAMTSEVPSPPWR